MGTLCLQVYQVELYKNIFFLSQYSGFQQMAEKCFICGHLIMEMVCLTIYKYE